MENYYRIASLNVSEYKYKNNEIIKDAVDKAFVNAKTKLDKFYKTDVDMQICFIVDVREVEGDLKKSILLTYVIDNKYMSEKVVKLVYNELYKANKNVYSLIDFDGKYEKQINKEDLWLHNPIVPGKQEDLTK